MTAILALTFLVCSITSYAGEWRQVSKTIDGNIGVFVPCSNPAHQKSTITPWPGPDENIVADARAYSCCESARAYSKGTVTKTFRWFPDDPETDPPPFISCVQHTLGFTHRDCNSSESVYPGQFWIVEEDVSQGCSFVFIHDCGLFLYEYDDYLQVNPKNPVGNVETDRDDVPDRNFKFVQNLYMVFP